MLANGRMVGVTLRLFISITCLLGLGGETGSIRENPLSRLLEERRLQSPAISQEQAIALAVNDLQSTQAGFQLSNPNHRADFNLDGLTIEPVEGGLTWSWELTYIGPPAGQAQRASESENAAWGIDYAIPPQSDGALRVFYDRGAVIEQYVLKQRTIEQQFILNEPVSLAGEDLVIEGAVRSQGTMQVTGDGWQWVSGGQVVSLGEARVFDARGVEIPARMVVEQGRVQIVLDGAALGQAVYPVTVDPEIGANDFRISEAGLLDKTGLAYYPDVAYNDIDDEYLVVWQGADGLPPMFYHEYEIWGQFVDVGDGSEIDADFSISSMGSSISDVANPAVTYNHTQNEFLVVWEAQHNGVGLDWDEYEIYGQRIDGATHALNGPMIRISYMGDSGDPAYNAHNPDVAWASTIDQYLVVWEGDDNTIPNVDEKMEIFGERLNNLGGLIEEIHISQMGAEGNTNFDAASPSVAYNRDQNEYLVVWSGDDNLAADDAFEIYGQRIDADNGDALGVDDRLLSDMGPDLDAAYDAYLPSLAYNDDKDRYLVAWVGDDNTVPLVDEEYEVFTQLLSGVDGSEILPNDQRISTMGPDSNISYDAVWVDVVYNGFTGVEDFLVVWEGDDNRETLVDDEFEIFAQRLDGLTGLEKGDDDFRISDMGGLGDANYDAGHPAAVHNDFNNRYLVVWDGTDNTPPLSNSETEIFGQRLNGASGDEVGVDTRYSQMWYDDPRTLFDAANPDVAYNPIQDLFLVVWQADNSTDGETEIYGRAIDAETGQALSEQTWLSNLLPYQDADYDNINPAVAYNDEEYGFLVVWEGDTNVAPQVDEEYEIYGRIVSYYLGDLNVSVIPKISDMGTPGSVLYDADNPDVAYNSTNNEYLVVWEADDNSGALVDGEYEIYGQRLDGETGGPKGTDDFRISDMNADGNANADAYSPAVAYDDINNQYLVVWYGDDAVGGLVNEENEIYGQLLDAQTGDPIPPNDFRISQMGGDGDSAYDAIDPAITYGSSWKQYLVVWSGDHNVAPLVDEEFEIFGQWLDAEDGSAVDADFRISEMGPDGDIQYDAMYPAAAYDSQTSTYLVIWRGDHLESVLSSITNLAESGMPESKFPAVNNEYEIYGQCLKEKDGSELYPFNERLSDMGPEGNTSYGADLPAMAVSAGLFLVTWYGDDNVSPVVDNNYQIFGQMAACHPYLILLPVTLR